MSIIFAQAEFMKDVARLITYAGSTNVLVTGGELYRTREQQEIYLQKGLTKTMNSLHLQRLAIDLNFFLPTGRWLRTVEELKPYGKFWEDLNTMNKWGGFWKNFPDVFHFERQRA